MFFRIKYILSSPLFSPLIQTKGNSSSYVVFHVLCFAGIPFGSVNLLHGVDKHESKVKQSSPTLPLLC